MQTPFIVGCSNCGSLKSLYNEIECTLIDLINRKWVNLQYNTSLSFNQSLYNDLVRYKRVVYNRLYNPKYPSISIDVQDIITQVKLRVYKSGDCDVCTSCFPPIPNSSSTSSSTTSSSTTHHS
jgi:hypothetical protein